jgi:hypothetical protein
MPHDHRINATPLTRSPREPADFQAVFRKSIALQLLLDPAFVILDASDAYLAATMTERGKIMGHHLFEIFPDNPNAGHADGVHNLRSSLLRVMQTRAPDMMAIQKYDVRRPTGGFEERYWRPVNWPILGEDGYVQLIVHQVEDVTGQVRAGLLKA